MDFRSVTLTVSAVAALPQPSVLFVLRPPHWLQEVLPDGGDPGQKLGTDGSQALLHRLVFFWLYLVPPGRINLSKLVWVCFFVLFYSLVHILSPSVLNHLSAGLIQFTEFLSGIWCRSLYHPIPPRPGWCI